MNRDTGSLLCKEYRADYLKRIFANFFIVTLVTLLYLLIGEAKELTWDKVLWSVFLLAVVNIGFGGLLALWMFRRLERLHQNRQVELFKKSLQSLPLKSGILIGCISLFYCLIIASFGYANYPEMYEAPVELVDFLLAIVYVYIVIPVYHTIISVKWMLVRIQRKLFDSEGIIFAPRKKQFRKSLLISFAILSVLPVSSLVLSMAGGGFFSSGQKGIGYNIATIVIIFFGIILTVMFRTRFFIVPIKLLREQAERIGNGEYGVQMPAVADDELGELARSFNRMSEGLQEREQMRDLFGKMVDPAIRDHLLSGNSALGGATMELTVLFSDIRNFTALTENMEPGRTVHWLNRYFEKMTACIAAAGGIVNKYIGDAVMALFGLPEASPDQADAALKAALRMRRALVELNREFQAEGLPEIRIGIGLHKGSVLAGNIGSSSRMEYTVIGDTVNLASRIEGLTKRDNTDLLFSEEVYEALHHVDTAAVSFHKTSRVKGRKAPVRLYTATQTALSS